MDFTGQKHAEWIFHIVIILCTFVGFIAGYFTQDINKIVLGCGLGCAIATVAVVPDWPYLNQNPQKWLPAFHPNFEAEEGSRKDNQGFSTEKKKKKKKKEDQSSSDAPHVGGGNPPKQKKKKKVKKIN